MKIAFKKYPIDTLLCIAWSFVLVPIVILDEGILRIIFSVPFIFFIPGYLIVSALFPIRKKERKIDGVERIALSFGLSIAIIPLLGFILNYTPWGIRLESIFFSLFVFIICIGAIVSYKWFKTNPNERFILILDLSFLKSESKSDKILTIMVIISIILAISFSGYILMNPQTGEPFTEFYLFDPGGGIDEYPNDLTMSINYSVNLEIDNHEYKPVNYTIDIWLINQTTDKGIVNWVWDFGDGNFGYGEFATHKYTDNGSYIVNLTVRDYDNAMDSIEQTVVVGNNPPVANNDTAIVIEDTVDNLIDILINDFDVDGDNITIVSVSSTSNCLATTDGSYLYYTPNPNYFGSDQLIYTIFDGSGETDTAIVSINVNNVNDPPNAGFVYKRNSPSTADVIYFASTSKDSDGYIVNWTWDFGDGYISYGELITHQYAETGSYNVNLTVKDLDNTIDSVEQTIVVRNKIPVAEFVYIPSSPSTADVINFDSTSIDSDGDIVNWTWNFGDGKFGYGEHITHRYAEIGTYNVKLTVKDLDNTTDSVEQTIVVENEIPVAEFVYKPSSPSTADVINFDSTSIDSDGIIVNWTWNFGDGNISYGEHITHRYAETGSYNVNLTVKDYDTATNSVEKTIVVSKKPPVAEFSYIPSSPSTEDVIYFNSTSTSENVKKTIIPNMWFLDKITTTLEHTEIDIEKPLIPQWEYNYPMIINRSGTFKLTFLLNTAPTENYKIGKDYKGQAENILMNAYRELHLWIDVYYRIPPEANFTYYPENSTKEDNIIFTSDSTSINSSITWWKWDFGDGNISYGETVGLKFDGIDDYADCGTNESLQPVNGTIEAWIYIKDNTGRRRIFTGSYFGGYRRHSTLILSNNILVLVLTNNSGWEGHTYDAGFQTDIWYHVAATWDGSHVTFFVNGSQKQTLNQSLIPAGNTDPKRIGALHPPGNPQAFHGTIKDVRIYNRSLNSTEIQNNHDGNVTTTDLVSWWKMKDSGDIAYDAMGRNNATIYGADWINQVYHKYSSPGTYNVTLTVSNEYRQIHSISKTITII